MNWISYKEPSDKKDSVSSIWYRKNFVLAAGDSASVYFKNGASFDSSLDDPTKTVALYAGRGEGANTSFYVQGGAEVSFAYIGQDANSGKVFYEVSGKNSKLTVSSREGNADGTIWHSNTGASIGNYKY